MWQRRESACRVQDRYKSRSPFCLCVDQSVGSWWFNRLSSPQTPVSLRMCRASHTVRTVWARSAGPRATEQSPTWPWQRQRTIIHRSVSQTPAAAPGMTWTVERRTLFTSSPTTTCAAACQATAPQYGWVNMILKCTSQEIWFNSISWHFMNQTMNRCIDIMMGRLINNENNCICRRNHHLTLSLCS